MSAKNPVGTSAWLAELFDAANECVNEAKALHKTKGLDTPFNSEAINWGDIGCINAYWRRDFDGTESAYVELSEAAPGSFFFCQWVSERLTERGFQNVIATSEW